jgi:predicted Zn-dependent protease
MNPLYPSRIPQSPMFSNPVPQAGTQGPLIATDQSLRWAKRDLPLLWSAEDFDTPLLESVMAEWSEASGHKIGFEPAQRSSDATLYLEWIDQAVIGRDYEVGHTNRRVQENRIAYAQISLLRNPAIDRHLSPIQKRQRLRTTLLHEIGHALGVEHSNNPEDVMYYRGWQNEHLSTYDAQRIRLLYASL